MSKKSEKNNVILNEQKATISLVIIYFEKK
jgi:hypothetical protein